MHFFFQIYANVLLSTDGTRVLVTVKLPPTKKKYVFQLECKYGEKDHYSNAQQLDRIKCQQYYKIFLY